MAGERADTGKGRGAELPPGFVPCNLFGAEITTSFEELDPADNKWVSRCYTHNNTLPTLDDIKGWARMLVRGSTLFYDIYSSIYRGYHAEVVFAEIYKKEGPDGREIFWKMIEPEKASET